MPQIPPVKPTGGAIGVATLVGLAGAAACTQFLTLNMPFGACARAIPSSARSPLERRARRDPPHGDAPREVRPAVAEARTRSRSTYPPLPSTASPPRPRATRPRRAPVGNGPTLTSVARGV